jgi:peroxiredoxin
MLPNKEGQRVPQATFRTRTNDKWVDISSAELFDGKTVVVFSLPGA